MYDLLPQGPAGLVPYGLADGLGTVGLVLYIGSYLALQLGSIRGDGYLYPLLNLVAAICVLVSLVEMFNLYAAIGEVVWIVISIIGIARLWMVHRFLRLAPEEAAAAAALVPGLAKDRVRRFLRLGRWIDAAPGEVLATEGAPVEELTFIAAGRCRIERGGVLVASIGAGGVVGEMTYRTAAPATATVVVEAPARLLRIDCAALRGFLARNEDVDQALELALAGDLRRKLTATTGALSDLRAAPGFGRGAIGSGEKF